MFVSLSCDCRHACDVYKHYQQILEVATSCFGSCSHVRRTWRRTAKAVNNNIIVFIYLFLL